MLRDTKKFRPEYLLFVSANNAPAKDGITGASTMKIPEPIACAICMIIAVLLGVMLGSGL